MVDVSTEIWGFHWHLLLEFFFLVTQTDCGAILSTKGDGLFGL